ncbi:MAG: hypothetical protein JWR58_5184 [Pseudonocardia sp.]|nr:hypothetical protein [Pseudonocardia sp.]
MVVVVAVGGLLLRGRTRESTEAAAGPTRPVPRGAGRPRLPGGARRELRRRLSGVQGPRRAGAAARGGGPRSTGGMGRDRPSLCSPRATRPLSCRPGRSPTADPRRPRRVRRRDRAARLRHFTTAVPCRQPGRWHVQRAGQPTDERRCGRRHRLARAGRQRARRFPDGRRGRRDRRPGARGHAGRARRVRHGLRRDGSRGARRVRLLAPRARDPARASASTAGEESLAECSVAECPPGGRF